MSFRSPLSATFAVLGLAFTLAAHAQTTPAPAKAEATPVPAATPAPAPVAAPAASTGGMDGLAAYYSNRLNGRKTASGQVFDQGKLTAAHPTLPFGTMVKVTNTKNNRSVVVRINDRGPTQPGRVIDLSRAAASKLGMLRAGLVPVKLEVVKEAPAKQAKK
jgi:rare lipoprotein A